ncbi:MAG: F0F1 ATP synthase subunit A [Planctomycetia bacterium]|nr:F0F1 ATP synthase subunit A [Planctomycetia bacterium]
MADSVLHIKDAYYFDVPKFMWRSDRTAREQFPDWWVRLDADYQNWEAGRQYDALVKLPEAKPADSRRELAPIPPKAELLAHYEAWKHEDHQHAGVPFDRFLTLDKSQKWFQQRVADPAWAAQWRSAAIAAAPQKEYQGKWEPAKIAEYNKQLHGKILIPQVFGGQPKNLYEPGSGFVVSKYMILELVVALVLTMIFVRFGAKMRNGSRVRGRLANLFETFLVFMRDQVARPAIGGHDADRFLPLLWTIFFFVLGCNLFGMVPWAGAPTSSFSVTLGMAAVTLGTVVVGGMAKMGPWGFCKNIVPHLGLPLYMAIPVLIILVPIEVIGLFIKHGVLAIRLLANMVAGHLVLLGIMGMGIAAATMSFGPWFGVASISVIASALFSLLELFVAFLQAYIFTFLSALFIGAAVHHH